MSSTGEQFGLIEKIPNKKHILNQVYESGKSAERFLWKSDFDFDVKIIATYKLDFKFE